ncbi:MAG: orotate phosphoribosyltransferase [Ignavibacteria bacterium RBG_13_36_8]|nr:MAG: orotate phosphoribosyltransferase [Ignavibacteria bacterium RBG_13_36_8]
MDTNLSKDERLWGMLCHISAFAGFVIPFGHILGPLIIWMIKKEEYAFVDEQGKEALNFQISVTIYAICAAVLIIILIGIPLLIGLMILDFVSVIVAAIKANDGVHYKYPLNMKIIN